MVKGGSLDSRSTEPRLTLKVRVLISCGEPSGRLFAHLLQRELGCQEPACRFAYTSVASLESTFGFWEGARSVLELPRRLRESIRRLAAFEADVAVLVAFPGFNLPFGLRCRRTGVPVVYLAPPQVWAWGRWRVGALRRAADTVVCLFPFEQPMLSEAGVPAVFTGYPLLDAVAAPGDRAEVLARLGLTESDRYVAFLPGSRPGETRFHCPLFAGVAGELERRFPGTRGVMLPYREAGASLTGSETAWRYSVIAHAECAVVVSGTATLETALLGVPQIVSYHLSPTTRLLARRLVRTRWFSLPNILLREDAVPEVLEPTVESLISRLESLLGDPDRRTRARRDAARLRGMLGPPGVLGRVARIVREAAHGGAG